MIPATKNNDSKKQMKLDKKELDLLEKAVIAWKLCRRSVVEAEKDRRLVADPIHAKWKDAGYPEKGALHDEMRRCEEVFDRMMDRMRKYGWRYDSSMRRIAKSLAPRFAEGNLKPVKGERVRRTRKANAR